MNGFSPFSRKQLQAISCTNARINILSGPVRSGKTISSIIAWINWIKTAPPGDMLMSAVSIGALKRNVLNDMFDILGENNYRFVESKNLIEVFGRNIWIVGANDERSESKIRGMTIVGHYDDETTLKPESFIKQALARMSIEGARAFWTTNPDSPYHYVYTEYLTNQNLISQGIVKPFYFTMEDNLSLSAEYKNSLKQLYSGVWYKRMILGLWVMAEGVVYDMWRDDEHIVHELPQHFDRYYVGVDFGTQNPTAFLLIGLRGDTYYAIKEYYYSGRDKGVQKTVGQYSADFKAFLGPIQARIYIDPSASPLIVQLQRDGVTGILHADNDVLPGIQSVANLLQANKFKIHASCRNLIKEFNSYRWDPKSAKVGIDKPIKEHDHILDSARYILHAVAGKRNLGAIEKPKGW